MPYDGLTRCRPQAQAKVVGRPRRDRGKNKAQRQARKRRR